MLSRLFDDYTVRSGIRFVRGHLENEVFTVLYFRGPNDVLPYHEESYPVDSIPKKRMRIYHWLLNKVS